MNNSNSNILWQIILITVLTLTNAFACSAEMAIVSVDKRKFLK